MSSINSVAKEAAFVALCGVGVVGLTVALPVVGTVGAITFLGLAALKGIEDLYRDFRHQPRESMPFFTPLTKAAICAVLAIPFVGVYFGISLFLSGPNPR